MRRFKSLYSALPRLNRSTRISLPLHRLNHSTTGLMHSFLEVIGPGTHDSSATLQLFFDEARYLFDCGDGTQRLCTEHTIKLSRLRSIHLTSLAAPSIGGLLGLKLTLADAGKDEVAITAPQGLKALFHAARSFSHRPSFKTTITEVALHTPKDPAPCLVVDDNYITMHAMPIRSRRDRQVDTGFGAQYDALAYLCRLRDIRGKFNPQKAMALGVKKGRNFGLLQKGMSITTEDGKVVAPKDVMSPSTPGPLVLILPCPSIDHIRAITACKHLQPVELDVLAVDGSLKRECVIVHLAPRNVLENTEYQEWCDSFGKLVSHIPIHHSVTSRRIVFKSQAEDVAMLHFSVDKELFPLPADVFEDSGPGVAEETATMPATEKDLGRRVETSENDGISIVGVGRAGKWIEPDCRLKFVLSPATSIGPDRGAVRPRFTEQKPGIQLRPWRDAARRETPEPEPAGTQMKVPSSISALPPRTAAVRFFGTGAAIPGKHRNVSSLMIDMFERGGVLMDCGEGTWGQMVRHFGVERAKRVLCELKVIFISHMHADHHLGLLTLLHERTAALREQKSYRHGPQLVIVGPQHLTTWLEAFQAASTVPLTKTTTPTERPYKFFDAASLTDPQAPESKFFSDAFGIEVGCVDVIHCPLSYGVVLIDCVNRWKVVYSGDTRPCPALGEKGQGATLAVHEATLDDDMEDEALEKLHCTTSEALDVCAKQMGAWRTILTHFSQRYPKVPKLNEKIVAQLRQNRATFAFDLMSIDFSRLEELPGVVPVLRESFPDEDVG